MHEPYDVVVVGGGTAGLTAGLFAARYGRRTLILERHIAGGQIINAERVENYPGFPDGIAGVDLCPLIAEQVTNAGAEIVLAEVLGLSPGKPFQQVLTGDTAFRAKSVIIASGSHPRTLGIPGEERLRSRGVSTCASCDAPFFEGQAVGIVGGGDTALDEALTLARYASSTIVFHRGADLDAHELLQVRTFGHAKIEVRGNTIVEEISGEDRVTGVRVRHLLTGTRSTIELAGLFVAIGLDPNTAFLQGTLPLDAAGHIQTDIYLHTPVAGIFAAGDVRQHSVAQVISAAGDGATAAIAAHRYIAAHFESAALGRGRVQTVSQNSRVTVSGSTEGGD